MMRASFQFPPAQPIDWRRSRASLWRFASYVRPYRRLIFFAVVTGIARYLIPLVMPWTLKVLVDDFLRADGLRPHVQLHRLMIGLCALYAAYAVLSFLLSYLAG